MRLRLSRAVSSYCWRRRRGVRMPSMRAVLDARKAGGDGLGARRPAVVLGWDSTSASRIEGAKARRKRLVERGRLVERKPGRSMLPAPEQISAGERPGGGSWAWSLTTGRRLRWYRCAARSHGPCAGCAGTRRTSASRRAAGSRSCISAASPVPRQRAKKAYARGQGGKSEGIAPHFLPLSTRRCTASIICRWQ